MLGSATTWRLSRELPSLICRNKTSFWERTERTQPCTCTSPAASRAPSAWRTRSRAAGALCSLGSEEDEENEEKEEEKEEEEKMEEGQRRRERGAASAEALGAAAGRPSGGAGPGRVR